MIDISIDPGKHGCGIAIWHTSARLVPTLIHAAYVLAEPHPPPYYLPPLDRSPPADHDLLAAAVAVFRHVDKFTHGSHGERCLHKVIIERPQHYQTAQQKGDQGDISELSIVVGAIACALQPIAQEISLVYPREWKGQRPKKVTTAQVKQHLSPEELAAIALPGKTLAHNVFDAVALGLYELTDRMR